MPTLDKAKWAGEYVIFGRKPFIYRRLNFIRQETSRLRRYAQNLQPEWQSSF
ncbi:MAG: hypothetical protein ACMXYF_00330 [Candidatus Woesearchaeota archaeon]